MQRLSFYLFKQTGLSFLFSGMALLFVVLFTQSFRLLSFVMDNSGTLLIFFQLMGLMVLTFLPLLLPLSLGVAVVFTYHKLSIDSELAVMRAVGASPRTLARPAVIMGGGVVLLGFLLTTWITPWANRELVSIQYHVRDNLSVFLIKSGAFNDLAEGLTFYVRERGQQGELEGILIHDVRTPERPLTIMAETGQFLINESGNPEITVFKGKRQEIDPQTGRLSQLDFDRYVVDIQVLRNSSPDRLPDPRELTTSFLFNKVLHPDSDAPTTGRASRTRMAAELNQRLTIPLLALTYSLIGVVAILVGPFNRRGLAKRIVFGAAAIIILQALTLSFGSLMNKQPLLAIGLYLTALLPIPACYAVLFSERVLFKPLFARLISRMKGGQK